MYLIKITGTKEAADPITNTAAVKFIRTNVAYNELKRNAPRTWDKVSTVTTAENRVPKKKYLTFKVLLQYYKNSHEKPNVV